MSQHVKNKKVHHSTLSRLVLFCSLHAVTSSVIYYSTHTRKKCYLFVLYNKNSNGLLKDFWGMKNEKQVRWRHLCVCPSIGHGEQPMEMHTEVMLLYNIEQWTDVRYVLRKEANDGMGPIFSKKIPMLMPHFRTLMNISTVSKSTVATPSSSIISE